MFFKEGLMAIAVLEMPAILKTLSVEWILFPNGVLGCGQRVVLASVLSSAQKCGITDRPQFAGGISGLVYCCTRVIRKII